MGRIINLENQESLQLIQGILTRTHTLEYTRSVCYNIIMKVRTNISIEKSLLESARLHKLVLSSLLEDAIKNQLSKVEEAEWKEKNSLNISNYNNYISTNGVFSDGIRSF